MPAPRTLTVYLSRTPISSVVVLLVSMAVAACSNGPSPVPPSTSVSSAAPMTGAPTTSSPATTGSAAPASPALSTPSAAPTGLAPVGAAIDALARTTSYRLVLVTRQGRTMDRYEILTINRPRNAWSASAASTGGVVRAIVVDDRGWVDRGSGRFAPAGVNEAKGLVGVDLVDRLLATYRDPALASALRFVGREQHGGTPADHYRAATDALRIIRPDLGATATLDVWIASDGHLVAISSMGSPGPDDGVQVEISDVDDPANVIETPG